METDPDETPQNPYVAPHVEEDVPMPRRPLSWWQRIASGLNILAKGAAYGMLTFLGTVFTGGLLILFDEFILTGKDHFDRGRIGTGSAWLGVALAMAVVPIYVIYMLKNHIGRSDG